MICQRHLQSSGIQKSSMMLRYYYVIYPKKETTSFIHVQTLKVFINYTTYCVLKLRYILNSITHNSVHGFFMCCQYPSIVSNNNFSFDTLNCKDNENRIVEHIRYYRQLGGA